MTKPETEDERLSRLTAATANLAPSGDFADRVMRAVEREPQRAEPWLARGITLGLLAMVAAAAVYVSSGAQTTLDSATLSAFDSVEMDL